ncbi:phosphatase [Arthrobacter sp. D2]|nr:phosphatase [Arthrobacter sp. M5]NKR15486.1 phosphatase [Arthrobacter sp. M6]OEH58479.1 phosphatase [Arthrobacter sp. D2]OEH64356.1 phosphatase [Arthrobacter sp. D4]
MNNGTTQDFTGVHAKRSPSGSVRRHRTSAEALNGQAVDSLTELGIDVTGEYPKPVTDEVLNLVDAVIVLGTEAKLDASAGKRFEIWETDEPSTGGIEGMERMRLVRDDIKTRVHALYTDLAGN